MEGMNFGAILAGYLAVLVFAITSLAALGLLIARSARRARIVFAAGLLAAAIIGALAMLSFLDPQFRSGVGVPTICVVALSLLLAGVGQFVAALRGGWTYAAAFACAALAIAQLASPLLVGDWLFAILGDFGLRFVEAGLPFRVVVSLVPAVGSLLLAILLPGPAGPSQGKR